MARPRIVLDCNAFVQAFLSSKGVAAQIIGLAESNLIEIYISREIIEELKEVLARPEFVAKFPQLTAESFRLFLKRLNHGAKYVRTGDESLN